jgi:hypothetical protein
MIVRDNAAGDTPEPLNAIGIRVIGRRVDQMELIGEFGQHAAHEQGALRRMGLEIVCNDNRHAPTLLRPRHRSTQLLTKDISGPPCRNPPIKPAVSPVYQPKAIDLAVIARRFDQPLPAPSLQAPDSGERGVK